MGAPSAPRADTELEMPKTETPFGVYLQLIVLAILIWVLLGFFLGGFFGLIVLFVILGFTTSFYTDTVSGYHARIVLNHLTGNQRTLFQGLNAKLPWESETKLIDLRVDINEVLKQTYTTLDGRMDAQYVYIIRPDFSGANPGEKIIRYSTYEPTAIKQEGRALFSRSLSDHYGKNNCNDLLDKEKITKEVFDDENCAGRGIVEEFQTKHGVRVKVTLEDSDYDEATQKARNTISQAKSFKEAVDTLMQPRKDEDGNEIPNSAMERPEAEKVAKMMNLPGVQEYIISLNAKGVENLRDVTILPPKLGGGGKK